MSSVHKRGPTTPEMNMTPLIDVTFQLIIFFMLVSNIVAQENVEMIVPELQNPKTRKLSDDDRITVNVEPMPFDLKDRARNNPLAHDGQATRVWVQLRDYGMDELEGIRAELEDAKKSKPEIAILLRADGALFYSEVQPVMDAISSAKISTVNVVAKMPPPGAEE